VSLFQRWSTIACLVLAAVVNVWIWEVFNVVAAAVCLIVAILIWRRSLEGPA
jgi:hypothetical protein